MKVVQNILNENVFAISTSENGTYENQLNLSFNTGDKALFLISDSTMDGYNLIFGTELDNSATVISSDYVTTSQTPGTTGASILLNLAGYSGDTVYYFENTTTNMGFVNMVDLTVFKGKPSNEFDISFIDPIYSGNHNKVEDMISYSLSKEILKTKSPNWELFINTGMTSYSGRHYPTRIVSADKQTTRAIVTGNGTISGHSYVDYQFMPYSRFVRHDFTVYVGDYIQEYLRTLYIVTLSGDEFYLTN